MKYNENELKEKSSIEGYYVLSSKQITNKYYDVKSLYCKNHNLVLDYFVERINSTEIDCIVSIELGGALIAVGLSERLNKSVAIFRKEKPSIGRPVGKCLIVDDVSTSGNSINIIKKWVEDCDAEISQVIVGIDRRIKNNENATIKFGH